MAALRKQVPNLNLHFNSEFTWAALALVDVLFVQRPYKREHAIAVTMAKNAGVPVWVDYDDDLFAVPTDNPAFELYNRKESQKAMIDCLKMADMVSVTTPALRAKIEKVNPKVVIIPNGFNDVMLGQQRPQIMRRRHPLVLWRGSQTHERDLMSFSAQIETAFKAYPEWTWNFIGYNPWFITDVLEKERCIVSGTIDVMEYFQFISSVQAAIQMVPLHDSPFNRAKSNIAMIEGAFAGSVTIAPAWPEWEAPGVLPYKNAGEFQDLMRLMLSDKKFPFYENGKATWEFVMDKLRLSKLNKWRFEILQELYELRTRGEPLGDFRE